MNVEKALLSQVKELRQRAVGVISNFTPAVVQRIDHRGQHRVKGAVADPLREKTVA